MSSKKIAKVNLLSLPMSWLMKVRIVLYLFVLMLSAINPNTYTFIGMALSLGILGVSILSNYESYNNCLVVKQLVSADKASRYMQAVIQIGAFAGAMIGGFLLSHFTFFFGGAYHRFD
ncbi:hypothetical protein LU293_02080 [Moraxella nasovis]|uniref:hypothetical protein n=1 Tax=Moraxella nasovis TaxID=2904121 RepID=UPI001F60A52A|nr:hypothetical protein [Moraxella nasovis]UNU73721.1 hypothetical protein LU293_02080 [Moraxella nasovis]